MRLSPGDVPQWPEQARLDVLRRQRLAQQRVVLQVDLADRQVVRRAPVRVETRDLVLRQVRRHTSSLDLLRWSVAVGQRLGFFRGAGARRGGSISVGNEAPDCCSSLATSAVHPVWWLAPSPRRSRRGSTRGRGSGRASADRPEDLAVAVDRAPPVGVPQEHAEPAGARSRPTPPRASSSCPTRSGTRP